MTSQVAAELPFYTEDGSFLGYAGYAAGLVLELTQAQESGPAAPQNLDGRLFEQRVTTQEGEVLLTITGVNRTLGRVAFNLTSEQSAALLPSGAVALDLVHLVAEVTTEGLTPLLTAPFALRRTRPGLGAVVLKLEPAEGTVMMRFAGAPPLTLLQELIAGGDLPEDATHDDMVQFLQHGLSDDQAAALAAVQAQQATSIAAVNAAGAAKVAAVNTAGGEQVAAVEDAGATQTAAVNAAGASRLSAVNTAAADQLEAIGDASSAAVQAVADREGLALVYIDELKDGAVAAVEAAGATHVGAVNAAGAARLAEVNDAGSDQVDAVNAAGASRLTAIAASGAEQVDAIEAAGATQGAAVNAAGAARVAEVNEAGGDQVDAVEAAGATQVGAVTATGADQVEAVETAGGQALTAVDTREAQALAAIAAAEGAETGPVEAAGIAALDAIALAEADSLADISAAAATAADNLAAGMITVWPTIAAGIAGVADAVRFAVEQVYGKGVYLYRRNGANADYLGVGLYGPEGQKISTIRAMRRLPSLVTPMPAEFTVNLWGVNAQEWDGRLLFNERAAAAPTLNLLWNPFSPVDEEGNATPAAITSDPGIVDADGGNNAIRLTSTGQIQQYAIWRAADDDLPLDDYRIRAGWITVSGSTAWRIGGNNVALSYTAFAATGAWVTQASPVITAYDNATKNFDINVSSGTGNTDGVAGVYCIQFNDPLAGNTLPTTATELAAIAGHGKRVTAYKGGIPFSSTYAIDHRTMIDAIMVQLQAALVSYSEATIGIWMSPTAAPATTYGCGISWKYRQAGSGSEHGLVGVMNTGAPYINPTLSAMSGKGAMNLIGQGFTSFFFTVKNGELIPYINGIKLYKDTGSWTTFDARALVIGAYNGVAKRVLTNKFVGFLDGAAFAPVALSAAKIMQADKHGRETLALCGSMAGLRKAAAFGLCDSMTMNDESYFWAMCRDTSITPHLYGWIDAVGGTNLANWETRKPFLLEQIAALDESGYEEGWGFAFAGANEWTRWRDDMAGGPYSYLPWKADYLDYLADLRAGSPKMKIIGLPMAPRAGAGGEPYSVNSLQVERERNAWNADLVANHAAMGIDFVIDWRADPIMQYATSANACASSGTWVNPVPNVTLFQIGGTHVTYAGGAQLASLWTTPWAKARLATLSGVL